MQTVPSQERIHITTLVYALRDERAAMLHRIKEPNRGLWSAPGGKVESDETPLENALRELTEETGLIGRNPLLSAIVTEEDRGNSDRWLMFVFRVHAEGELVHDGPEGTVEWVALADITALPKPPADPFILAAIRSPAPTPHFLHVVFDDGRLIDVRTTVG